MNIQKEISGRMRPFKGFELPLILAILVVSIVGLAVSFQTNQLVRAINKPQFSVNRVYLSEAVNGEQNLVIEYQNVGGAQMQWLGISLKLISNNISVAETINVVFGNSVEPGVKKQTVNKLTQPAPQLLILCARWLDDREVLSTSEWYYSISPQQYEPKVRRYVDAGARERAQMKDMNACRDISGNLR